MDVHGTCDDAFGPVRDAFVGNFDQGNEVGASVAVTHHGRSVVDLWAGDADQAGRPWEQDTIVNVYSTTKTMAATCVLMLADRGEIDLDAPVADLWPEFGANGKEGVLVRHVMSHSAGLSGFEPAITATDLYDWDRVCELLAAQAPWWEPGAKSGYHAITQGYLQGELVRRATGRSVGTYFREEVAGPLGADFHIGLPASEDHRVADLVPPDLSAALGTGAIQPDTLAARTLLSCPLDATEPRTRAWRGAEIPAAGGTGNARSVARVHSVLACGGEVDGVRLMSADGVERILEEQISGTDGVLGRTDALRHGLRPDERPHPAQPQQAVVLLGWVGWLARGDRPRCRGLGGLRHEPHGRRPRRRRARCAGRARRARRRQPPRRLTLPA